MEIQAVIRRIYKRTTQYSDPKQATTTASALDLLSSGIYTEEERFVFELLQNAVDSFDEHREKGLSVKIVSTDDHLIFMHNGTPFSERDLEGLCDIGNGNKTKDAKKIGYKGIGFKSVFMHSHKVTIWTDGTCFKFDKQACEEIRRKKGYSENVKMPWQIIPIPTTKPNLVDTTGYSVVTYITTRKSQSLRNKVEKLLSDSRFLLFLNVADLNISFCYNNEEILSLSKSEEEGILSLCKNDEIQSRWLTYSKTIELTPEIKEEIVQDSKTPTKLKESTSVDISFAIAIGEDGNIEHLDDALIYTYLPTSFKFGLPFVVNANFITDAGRQQLVYDSEWNKFIFSLVPKVYLSWIKSVISDRYKNWYDILLPLKNSEENELTASYMTSLYKALASIPFVKTISGEYVLVKDALCDTIGLSESLVPKIYEQFIQDNILSTFSLDHLITPLVGIKLSMYKACSLKLKELSVLLENSNTYLSRLSDNELIVFLKWLKDVSSDNKDLLQNLSFFRILFDENGNLVEPSNLFFPTTYRDDNELAETAKVMSESFFALLDDDTRDWLSAIGVSEMSNISVIDNILCEEDFITEENSIPVIQFIFDANKRVNIFDEISSYRLSHLRFLTKEGSLKSISELYLCTAYHPNLNIESILDDDIYVSPAYIRTNDNIYDWTYFFQKLGINTSFELNEKRYYGLDAKQLKFFDKPTALANKVGYDSFNGCTYYFNVGTFEVYYFPLIMEFSDESHIEFTKYFWNEVLCKEKPEYHTEYIRGASGFIPRCLNLQNYSDKQYFIDWQINNNQYFPTTMGDLRQIRDVLPNTKEFRNLCGEYFPVLDIQGDIHQSWYNTLNFKDGLTLSDCLIILERISDEIDRSCFVENKRRINYVYEKISSDFDCSNKDNFKILNTWGETHQILSKDGRFESPSRLYLLSSKLSRVDIENQVYHEKSLENNRFASMMTAMGVRFINDYTVDCSESEAIKDESIVTALVEKTDFLTAITTSESFDNNSWEKAKSKMQDNISKLVFLKVPSIKITYGDQSFDKTAYASDFKFYYVEKWGVANQELVHEELSKALNIKDKSTMLAVIRMNNGIEIKEYLEQKGYDVSRISDAQVAALTEEDKDKRIQELERQLALLTGSSKKIPEMGGENAPFGGLSKSDMHAALEEAKDTILNRLQTAGYDISRAEWDGHTCINGVSKDGIEYPLVVRSNRSKSNTKINPEDWNQLMKPNAIFAVNTSSGPGTIRFRDLLKSKDNITIRFSSENIDSKKHIAELAHVLAYFKGIQFDFERYVQPVIGSWERFLAPEQNTGELPQAGSDNLLPD